MTCEERRDSILLYAADALDDEGERAELAAHLATGCAQCAGSLAEAQAVLTTIALSAEPLAPPPGAAERLMSSIGQSIGVTASIPTSPPLKIADYASPGLARPKRSRRPGTLGTALIAACIAGLLSGLTVWFSLRERARLPVAPEVQYVDMRGGETQPLAHARIFWDTVRHRWHVYFFDLRPPPPGRSYQFWLVSSDNARTPAGTVTRSADGRASLTIDLPQDIAPLVGAEVTDEPPGGSRTPIGRIHMLAKIP